MILDEVSQALARLYLIFFPQAFMRCNCVLIVCMCFLELFMWWGLMHQPDGIALYTYCI